MYGRPGDSRFSLWLFVGAEGRHGQTAACGGTGWARMDAAADLTAGKGHRRVCGFSAVLDLSAATPADQLADLVRRMARTLAHRGPDSDGCWVDGEAGVALGFRRLAIQDLSQTGEQPMISTCHRFVVVYNGEVTTDHALKEQLQARGRPLRGSSDTELILESCAAFGVDATIERLVGMFAFALWDRSLRRLTLVRDRIGIKPLYFGRFGHTVLIGSQPKCLREHPAFEAAIDRDTLARYFGLGYIPAPHSIYRGVRQVRPGHMISIEADGTLHEHRYWDACRQAVAGAAARDRLSDAGAADRLEALLSDSIGRQMVADVPVGAFLSGGIDSSTVAALMQARSERPIETFAMGFDVPAFDETSHAEAVARHLRTSHSTFRVDGATARDLLPQLPDAYDEPFADVSQIPTMLVSRLARAHVKVVLSGDGGDELFAGYPRYHRAARLHRAIGQVPGPLRVAGAQVLDRLARIATREGWGRVTALMPAAVRPRRVATRASKLAQSLREPGLEQLYFGMLRPWLDPAALVPGSAIPADPIGDGHAMRLIADPVERMQLIDLLTYLPDDILTKLDRASMAVGLEARVPLLDHRVVEHAMRLPFDQKVRHGTSKWLLREVLYRHVPRTLIERPKMGFGAPVGAWLRGPLRDWAESLLSTASLEQAGLRAAPIRACWKRHVDRIEDGQSPLWTVLMFQSWRQRWRL